MAKMNFSESMLGIVMPQMQLPIFPEGVTHINHLIAFKKQEETITRVLKQSLKTQ